MLNIIFKNWHIPISLLALIVITFSPIGKGFPIKWSPEKLETTVFQGGIRTINLEFTSKDKLSNIDVFIVPELSPFVKTIPEKFESMTADTTNKIQIIIAVPANATLADVDGTIHLRSGKKTLAKPFPVTLHIISSEEPIDIFFDSLINNYGTITIPVDPAKEFELVDLSEESVSAFHEGTDGPIVVSVISPLKLRFLPPENPFAREALKETLLPAVIEPIGVRVIELQQALENHKIHAEPADYTIIPIGADAITYLPSPNPLFTIQAVDQNKDGFADFYFIIFGRDTHAIHRPADVDGMISSSFIDTQTGKLTRVARVSLHELIHAASFRTECKDYDFLLSEEEESYTAFVEALIASAFEGTHTELLNTIVEDILGIDPGLSNCLQFLDLTRPTPVNLETPVILE